MTFTVDCKKWAFFTLIRKITEEKTCPDDKENNQNIYLSAQLPTSKKPSKYSGKCIDDESNYGPS